MANKQKNFKGYVHEVSGVKTAKSGNAEYFNFHLQQKASTRRGVCFDKHKHTLLSTAMQKKQAVQLTDATADKGKDIRLHEYSTCSVGPVTYKWQDPSMSTTTVAQMATNKRNLDGYPHEVSPLKKAKSSGNEYFDMKLQDKASLRRVVCFDKNKHQLLSTAMQEKKAVGLIDALEDTCDKGKDIKLFTSSTCQVQAVPYPWRDPFATTMTVNKVTSHQDGQSMSLIKQSYSMVPVNGSKGKACIIDVHSFPGTGWSTLHGYMKDTLDLKELWESLGFQVSIPEAGGRGECLTGKEIEAAVEQFARTLKKENDQCAILCFSSHGGEGEVYGSDGEPVKIASLLVKLNNENCKEMAGKPKVVIFQACQGAMKDKGKRVPAGSTPATPKPDVHLPTVSDLIVCTPSLQGHVSFVCCHEADDSKIPCGPQCGSDYMQALVEVFTKYAGTEDILTMLTMVNHEVAKKGIKYKNEDYKQMPEFRSTLTKQLFFYDKGSSL